MNRYPYQLQPYKGTQSRHLCPHCKQKSFVRYVDTQTGEYISTQVGRCNREVNCGYHYTPKQYLEDNAYRLQPMQTRYTPSLRAQRSKLASKEPIASSSLLAMAKHSSIPLETVKASLKGYDDNRFVQYLLSLFDSDTVSKLVDRYLIGTSKHWQGATVFWQVDAAACVRTGKVMLYNPATGKRVKEPYSHITWVHCLLKQPDYTLKQCLFGEHLLRGNTKPVAVVESEKTAAIASVYLPQYLWLAVGSLSNLTAEKCSPLQGCEVLLFPDLNGFDKWAAKAQELASLARFTVVDLLELIATPDERQQGLDLADYLVRYHYSELAPQEEAEATAQPQPEPYGDADEALWPEVYDEGTFAPPAKLIPQEDWSQDIADIEAFFSCIDMDKLVLPIKPNPYTTINNIQAYVESELHVVKANNGKRWFRVYLERLMELKVYIQ